MAPAAQRHTGSGGGMSIAERLVINERAHTAQTVVEQLTKACPSCGKPDPGICTSCDEYPDRMHCGCRHTRTRRHHPMHDDRYNIIKTSADDQPPEHDPGLPWVIIHPRLSPAGGRAITRCPNYPHAVALVALLISLDRLAAS